MKFSIVTPCFDQFEWLKLCAASVADQSSPELFVEHIIQDGGFTVDTNYFETASSPRNSIRIIQEQDSGMYNAINRGLQECSGNYLAHLNCDEQYFPNTLEKVASYFNNNPDIEIVFGDAILIDPSGTPYSYRKAILPNISHVRLDHLPTLTCATFYRQRIIEKGHYFPENWKAIADGAWMLSLLRNKIKMGILNEPLAAFTLTGSNLGDSSEALHESQQFRRANRQPFDEFRKPFTILQHRVKKLMAGAYINRTLTVSLFTPDSLQKRMLSKPEKIGFRWRP